MDETTDKRKIANLELKDYVSLNVLPTTSESSNYVELPKEESSNYVETGGNSNNINVNINIDGNKSPQMNQVNETKTIVNNVLQTNTNPADIKKNSSQESQVSGEKVLGDREYLQTVYREYDDAGYSIIPEMMSQFATIGSLGSDEFNNTEVSKFQYSDIRKENKSFIKNLNIVRNITNTVLGDLNKVTYSPQNAIKMSIANVTNVTQQYSSERSIEVSNERSNIDGNEKNIREAARKREMEIKRIDEVLLQLKKNKDTNDGEDGETEYQMKEGSSYPQDMFSSANQSFVQKNKLSSLNDSGDSTIGIFVNKMNNPPVWRIVLG